MKLLWMMLSKKYRDLVSAKYTNEIINRHYYLERSIADMYKDIYINSKRIAA